MLRLVFSVFFVFLTTVAQSDEPRDADINYAWLFGWATYLAEIKSEGSGGGQSTTTDIISHNIHLERRISDVFDVGFDINIEDQTISADALLPGFTTKGSLEQESYEVSAFGRYKHTFINIEAHARAGADDYELTRPDQLSSLVARSKSSGYHVGFYLEANATIPLNEVFFIRPVVDLDYEYTQVEPFSETGAAFGNVNFGRVEDHRTIGQAGFAIGAVLPLSEDNSLTMFANTKYRRNFNTSPVETTAVQPLGLGNLGKQALAEGPESEGIILDAGTILASGSGMEIWTVYRGQFYEHSTRHGFAGQIRIPF